MTPAGALGALLEETEGVVGVVLGTAEGELRAVRGDVASGDAGAAATAAVVTRELAALGRLFGLGELGVASLRAPSATRVFSRQASTVLAVELGPERPLGELEAKLRQRVWAPDDPRGARGSAPALASAPEPATLPPPPHAPARRSVASAPAFTGDLEELGIPDLLEFLRTSQRTGLLLCTTPAGIGRVELSRGMIVAAASPNALDLRQQLLASAELAPEQRRALAAVPSDSFRDDAADDAIAAVVSREAVDRARVARIYSAFREMISWTSGRFAFDPGIAVTTRSRPAVSAQSILMQLVREEHDQGAPEVQVVPGVQDMQDDPGDLVQ